MLKRNDKGFTLIELLVVMAVLAILVMLAVPRYLGYTKDAEVTAMKADTKVIEQAAYQYALNNSDAWPVGEAYAIDDEGVKAIVDKALADKGATATNADIAAAIVEIKDTLINPYIRSTKNPIGDYFIISRIEPVKDLEENVLYNNELEGVVFSKAAFDDSDGTLHSGLFDNAE